MQNITFNMAFENYLNYIKINVKPTTVISIKRNFKLHILSFCGNILIKDFSENMFFKWQNYLKNKGFSRNFEKNVQIMFKKFLDYLSQNFEIKNYVKIYGYINNYSIENQTEKNVFSMREFKKFIKNVDNPIYKTLFNLLYFTGCRKGEALALKFSDLEQNFININKTLTTELINGSRLELAPKTKKSTRKIRIDNKLKHDINKLRDYYIKNLGECKENFYIFGGNNPIACTTLKRKKDFYCDKAKVKRIRIHDFRHSHATFLYDKNIKIKTIQERLGHANINTTINTYVHDNQKNEKKVTKLITFSRLF